MAEEKRQLVLDLLARAKTKKGTDEAADDLDRLGDAAERADKKTKGLGKSSDETAGKTDKLGHNLESTKSRVVGLDKEIGTIQKELAALSASFADASSASERLDISKAIRRTENDLRRVTKNRNVLADLLPDPEPEAKSFVKRLTGALSTGMSTIGETIASNKYLVAGVAGAVVSLAPLISGVIAGAVVGGIGIGGIIGGIALAAKSDAQIKSYATNIGKSFTERLQVAAQAAFSGTIMQNLGKVEEFANKAATGIGKVFQNVAPYVSPLVDSLIRVGESLGKSIVNASAKAGPAIKAFGRLAEGAGESLGKFIDMAASHAQQGADAIDVLNKVLTTTIDVVTFVVDALLNFKGAMDQVDDAIDKGRYWLEDHVSWLDLTADGYKKGSEAAKLYRDGVIGAAGSANDYDHYLQGAVDSTNKLKDSHTSAADAAKKQQDAEKALTDQLKAQTDPAFGLLRAIDGVREAHKNAAEATRKYGGNSEQAREATRKLAEAAINLQSAAGQAKTGLDGTLSPSLRATLKTAGLTAGEIANVEKELRQAKKAAEAYAQDYTANITTTYTKNYVVNKGKAGNSRYPDEQRAAGGPVVRGTPYLVGENGPEIVVPDASGRVLNSSASRGLMVQAGMTGSTGTASALSQGGGGGRAIVEVTGSADQGVATLINYLIRTGKLNVTVAA